MTPAAAATAIRAAIEEGCRKDPEYLALVLRELATLPVPADAKERGWAAIQSELRTERCVSACPQPVVGQNAGSTGLAARGVTVTSPRQGATHSGALAAVGRGDEPLRDRHPRSWHSPSTRRARGGPHAPNIPRHRVAPLRRHHL
jgi:hypothetical protein